MSTKAGNFECERALKDQNKRRKEPKQAIHEDQLLDALLLILQIDNFLPQQLDVPRTIGILRDK